MGIAAVGAVFLAFGIACLHWWKTWEMAAGWAMLVAGLCMASGGAALLLRAGNQAIRISDSATGYVGAAGAGGLILALLLGVHAFRGIIPKRGPRATTSHAYAAFFFPVVVIALGGLVSVLTGLGQAGSTGVSQLTTFFGGGA